MENKLQKKLYKRFKFLNINSVDEKYPYPMFGIEVGDGWYNLLYKLFEKIEKEIDMGESFGGFTQIKEKFGLLRIYCLASDKIYNLIDKYENKSAYICEICGKRGKLRNPCGWYFTACEKHFDEYCINHLGRKLNFFEKLKQEKF